FFQAEDGIRDFHVTGVQTCALPISRRRAASLSRGRKRPAARPRSVPCRYRACPDHWEPDTPSDRIPARLPADGRTRHPGCPRKEIGRARVGKEWTAGASTYEQEETE